MGRCPKCGSTMKQQVNAKGNLFVFCSRWPVCKVSGTPELFEVVESRTSSFRDDVSPIGPFVNKLAALRILQSQLRQADTEERRDDIRRQAKDLMQKG